MPYRPTKLTPEELETIRRLYLDGWGQIEIARKIGRSQYTVRDVLRGKSHGGPRLMNGKRPGKQLAIYDRQRYGPPPGPARPKPD